LPAFFNNELDILMVVRKDVHQPQSMSNVAYFNADKYIVEYGLGRLFGKYLSSRATERSEAI
jgi:hypothetical protein